MAELSPAQGLSGGYQSTRGEYDQNSSFQWTAIAVLQSIAIFCLAGVAEILGGWLVWAAVKGHRDGDNYQAVEDESSATLSKDIIIAGNSSYGTNLDNRNDVVDNNHDGVIEKTIKKPWYYALFGSFTLVAYGFIPCLQPSAAQDGFGRIYAAYGGFFIVLSFLFGWVMDGDRPDLGDVIGGAISLVGVLVIMFWPGSIDPQRIPRASTDSNIETDLDDHFLQI